MSTEALKLICAMDRNRLEAQIGLQCAPLLTGLKISNLLTIPSKMRQQVSQVFRKTGISVFLLYQSSQKTTFFLYREQELEWALKKKKVRKMMEQLGYQSTHLPDLLRQVAERYEAHMALREEFPHELGLLLGYPPEDVAGFILHKGKNFLYSGYWKVYENPEKSLILFQQFESAREEIVRMMSAGISIEEILEFYQSRRVTSLKSIAV